MTYKNVGINGGIEMRLVRRNTFKKAQKLISKKMMNKKVLILNRA
jgi:hypothetical protein